MKWFRHDSNANQDAKLKKLRMRYGLEGYGMYWYCLELIAIGVDKNNINFELEHDSEILSHDLSMHIDKVSEIMCYMVKLGLFEDIKGIITCLSLARRADEYTARALKLSLKKIKCPDSVPILSGAEEKRREEKRRKEIKQELNWDELNIPDEQKLEIRNIRKDIKKPLTKTDQRALNGIIKNFNACLSYGYTIDQILNEWTVGKWQTIKLEYLKNTIAPEARQHPLTNIPEKPKRAEYTEEQKKNVSKIIGGLQA